MVSTWRTAACFAVDAAGNRIAVLDATDEPSASGEVPDGALVLAALECALPNRFAPEIACLLTTRGGYLRADFWNPDGTREAVCGNALRAIPLLVMIRRLRGLGTSARHSLTPSGSVEVETARGRFTTRAVALGRDLGIGTVTVEFGKVPSHALPDGTGLVDPGTPHRVWPVDDLTDPTLPTVAASLTCGSEPVSVTFVRPSDAGLQLRTFERGVGETQSCGTGAIAAYVFWTRHQAVHLPRRTAIRYESGQCLEIAYPADSESMAEQMRLCLSGPVRLVF